MRLRVTMEKSGQTSEEHASRRVCTPVTKMRTEA